MAQYHPGHVHIERTALNKNDHSYDLNIEYEAASDPKEGRGIQFHMHGIIEGKTVEEKFFPAKDRCCPASSCNSPAGPSPTWRRPRSSRTWVRRTRSTTGCSRTSARSWT